MTHANSPMSYKLETWSRLESRISNSDHDGFFNSLWRVILRINKRFPFDITSS